MCEELQGEGSVGFISSWGFKEKEEIKMYSTFLEHKNVLTLEAAGADNAISWEERKKKTGRGTDSEVRRFLWATWGWG